MIILRRVLPPITHLGARKLEWGVAVCMAGWATTLAQPDETMLQPQFAVLHRLASETAWTWLCALIAASRLCALWMNGTWGPSPIVRGATAAVSSLFWCGVWLGIAASGRTAVSLTVYFLLMLADIDSVYHAASDWQAARERRTRELQYARSSTG